MSIPEWLKGMLKEGRYRSVYEMSHAFNVPQPTVHRWLTGQTTPSAPYCMKIAQATDTPVQDVIRMAYGDGDSAAG